MLILDIWQGSEYASAADAYFNPRKNISWKVSVFGIIQFESGKIMIRITPNTDNFHEVETDTIVGTIKVIQRKKFQFS